MVPSGALSTVGQTVLWSASDSAVDSCMSGWASEVKSPWRWGIPAAPGMSVRVGTNYLCFVWRNKPPHRQRGEDAMFQFGNDKCGCDSDQANSQVRTSHRRHASIYCTFVTHHTCNIHNLLLTSRIHLHPYDALQFYLRTPAFYNGLWPDC